MRDVCSINASIIRKFLPTPPSCCLIALRITDYSYRQVYDIPPFHVFVRKHRAEQKVCPCYQKTKRVAFPADVPFAAQYGEALQTFIMYCHYYQLLPYERTAERLGDLGTRRTNHWGKRASSPRDSCGRNGAGGKRKLEVASCIQHQSVHVLYDP